MSLLQLREMECLHLPKQKVIFSYFTNVLRLQENSILEARLIRDKSFLKLETNISPENRVSILLSAYILLLVTVLPMLSLLLNRPHLIYKKTRKLELYIDCNEKKHRYRRQHMCCMIRKINVLL